MKLLKRRLLLCSHNYRSFSLKIILPKPNLLCISLFQRAKKKDLFGPKGWGIFLSMQMISQSLDRFNLFKDWQEIQTKEHNCLQIEILEKVLKSQIFTLEDGNFRVIFHAWIPYPFIFKQLCKFSGCKKYCAFVTYDLLFPLNPFSTSISGYNCQFYTIFSRTRNDLQNE